jgi:thiosulfate reductase/polysulfide reductase chain A
MRRALRDPAHAGLTRRELLRAGALAAAGAALPWPARPLARGESAVLEGVVPAPGPARVATTCNLCVVGCTVLAIREGERVVRLAGHPDSPVNRGRLCAKGHAGLYKAIHPERLRHPLLRVGARGEGRFERVSWERALGAVAEGLQRIRRDFGPRSVALWQNVNMDRPDLSKRLVYALGSPNFIGHVSTCDASRLIAGATTFGVARAVPDYANAECILAVGVNPLAASGLVPSAREILEAKAKGAALVTVDPRLSETAARSDLWLPIRPGTDGTLLAGLARWLIEEERYDRAFVAAHAFGFGVLREFLKPYGVESVCATTGLPRERFLRAARLLAGRRSVVVTGRGVVTHRDGTDAARIGEALNALLGAFDREGGVRLIDHPPIPLARVEPEVEDPGGERIDGSNGERLPLPFGRQPRYPAALLGVSHELPRNLLAGDPYELKAIVFHSVNPVYSLPQGRELVRAFEKLALIVAIDAFPSETTRYADVVLPASTYLEGLDLWFPAQVKASLRQPVLAPQHESRPAQEILLALAAALGLSREFPFRRYEDFLRAQLGGSGVELEDLRARGFVPYGAEELRFGRRRAEGFATPSGRVELVSSVLAALGRPVRPEPAGPPAEDAAYPYHLVTHKLPFHTQSATAENPYLAAIQSWNPVVVNPDTAAALGVATGDRVELESERGALVATVRVSAGIRPDTLALAHHFGHTAYSRVAAGRGVSGNAVIADGTDPVGGNLAFNDTRVRVRRL